MSKLDGVCGDARKRIEAAALPAMLTFDLRPECLLCGRRDNHTHGPDLNYAPLSVTVTTVPEQ